MRNTLLRWKYRWLVWFHDAPNALARRVAVENQLMAHVASGVPPTIEECRVMAQKLGVPTHV